MISIYAYDSKSASEIRSRFPALNIRNNNIEVIGPAIGQDKKDEFHYDLPTFNKKVLGQILSTAAGKESA